MKCLRVRLDVESAMLTEMGRMQEMIAHVSAKPIHRKKLIELHHKHTKKNGKAGIFGKIFSGRP